MNARTIVHVLLLAIAGAVSYGGALLLLSSCDSVQSPLTSPPDSGPPPGTLDSGSETSTAPPFVDASPPHRVHEGGAGKTYDAGAEQLDAHHELDASHDAGRDVAEQLDAYCSGFTDAGYLEIDGSTGFRFPWESDASDLAVEGGAPCSGFGCWYQVPGGPAPQSSNCPIGLVCLISRDASLANPDDYRGTCERLTQ
jgi:hypothetical protein